VDTVRFSPDRPSRLGLRAERNVSETATVVGCVAHLLPVKNQEMLIRAVAKVPGTLLWLAGREDDPTYVSGLRRLVSELSLSDRVTFFGDVRDIPSFLTEIDIFALPTRAEGRMEGCPVALLEAMASGRACVATDVPGSRDIVEPGRSGGLVPSDDADALAGEIRRLAENPPARRALGEAARRRVVENYSIEREVEAHESLYDEVLGRASLGSAA